VRLATRRAEGAEQQLTSLKVSGILKLPGQMCPSIPCYAAE
jgi:hypothetical protein